MGMLRWIRTLKTSRGRAVLADQWGQTEKHPPSGTRQYLEQYSTNPLIYAAVKLKAQSVASVDWELLVNGDSEASHIARATLQRPNPEQGWFEFVEEAIIYLELGGDEFIEKARSPAGIPVELWNMRPDYCHLLVDEKDGSISGLQFKARGREVEFDRADFIRLIHPNPNNDWRGQSVVQPIADELVAHEYGMEWMKQFMKTYGAMFGYLTTESHVGQSEMERVARIWNKGLRAKETPVLPLGLTWKSLGRPPKESGYVDMMNSLQDEFLAALGVPPVKLGLVDKSKYADYILQSVSFVNDTVKPLCRKLKNALERDFLSEWNSNGTNLTLKFYPDRLLDNLLQAAKHMEPKRETETHRVVGSEEPS